MAPQQVQLDFSKAVPIDGATPQSAPAPQSQSQPQAGGVNPRLNSFLQQSVTPMVAGQAPQPQPQGNGVTLDFSKAVPVDGSGENTPTAPPKTLGQNIAGGTADFGRGLAEGALDTFNRIGAAIVQPVRKAVYDATGNTTIGDANMSLNPLHAFAEETPDEIKAIAPNTLSSKAGKFTEGVGEWLGGGELVDLGKGLIESPKILSFLAEHPNIANMIEQGIVGGGHAEVHGQNVPEGAAGGAVAGAAMRPLSAVIGAGSRLTGSVLQNTADMLPESSTVGSLLGKAGDYLGGTAKPSENAIEDAITKRTEKTGIKPGIDSAKLDSYLRDSAQDVFHQDIRQTLEDTVKDALNGKSPSAQPRISTDGGATTSPVGQADLRDIFGGADVSTEIPTAPHPNEFANAPRKVPGEAPATANAATAQPEFNYEQPDSLRDVGGKAARTVLQSSKADYAALDEASGGQWQRFSDSISNLSDEMDKVAGIDDDKYAALEGKRIAVEGLQQRMLDQMKASGKVDPALADRAQATFKQSMALNDLDKALKMSVERTVPSTKGLVQDGETATERVNPNKLSLRLQKLNDVPLGGGPSRLEQAVGADRAKSLIDSTDYMSSVSNADLSLPSVTGQKAFKAMLRDNTFSNPNPVNWNATRTDWASVQRSLDKTDSTLLKKTYGYDLPRVKAYVNQRVRAQQIGDTIKWVAKQGTKYGLPVLGGAYEAHKLLSGGDDQ